jgi:Tfp pilus assembly protein PilF
MQTRLIPLLLIALAALLGACSKPREITSLDRAEADARAAKARVELQLGSPANAEKLLVEALAFNPDAYAWWVDLANIRLQAGKNQEARKACEQAVESCQRLIEQNPGAVDIRVNQIRLLVSLGDKKAAQKTLDQAGKDLPQNQIVRGHIDNKLVEQLAADPGLLKLPK